MIYQAFVLSQLMLLSGYPSSPRTAAPAAKAPIAAKVPARRSVPAQRSAPARWVEVRPVKVKPMPAARPSPARRLPPNHPTIQRLPPNHPKTNRLPSNHPPLGKKKKAVKSSSLLKTGKGRALSKQRLQGLVGFYLTRIRRNQRTTTQLSRTQEQRARGLADVIMAPCCYTQPASIHGNEVAAAVKATLRWLVSLGYTDDQIKAAFVRAYHPHILSVSSAKSIYVIPLVVAILALLLVCFVVWRWYRRSDGTTEEFDDEYYDGDYYDEYEDDSDGSDSSDDDDSSDEDDEDEDDEDDAEEAASEEASSTNSKKE